MLRYIKVKSTIKYLFINKLFMSKYKIHFFETES